VCDVVAIPLTELSGFIDIQEKDMKLPENKITQTKYRSASLNTLTLTGLSLLWAVMLSLITPWWLIGSVLLLLAGYSNEISERTNITRI